VLIRLIDPMVSLAVDDRTGGLDLPVIFVVNHHSSVDPFLFGMLPLEMAFITSWPFRIPVYRWFMHLAGYINTADGWSEVDRRGRTLLASGCSLIVWPEGHRSKDGRLRRFRNGAFHLAVRAGRPIVPVCISGTDRLLPPGRRLLVPSRVTVTLLAPISVAAGTGDDDEVVRELREQAHFAIHTEWLRQRGAATVVGRHPVQQSECASTELASRG